MSNAEFITPERPVHLVVDGMTPQNIVESNFFQLPGNLRIKAEKRPLYYENNADVLDLEYNKADNAFALVDKNSDTFLGTCTETYKIVDHEEVEERTSNALLKHLRTDGAIIRDYAPDNGRKWIREITLPDESFTLGNGELHNFRLYIRNSYNAAFSLTIFAGPMRLKCFNGMFVGSAAFLYRHKHTANMDVTMLGGKFTTAIDHFKQAPQKFEQYQRKTIVRADATRFLKDTMCLVKKPDHDNTYNKARLDQIMKNIDENGPRRDSMTAWDLLNGMTAWATHHPAARSNEHTARQRRLEQVQFATSSKRFKELVNVAA